MIMDPGQTGADGKEEPWFRQGGPCTNPDPDKGDPSQCSDAEPGTVIDDTWIVQPKHGAFDRALAPRRVPPFNPAKNRQYDHWRGRMVESLPPSHINQTVAMIADFREHYGEGKWLRAELNQLEAFEDAFARGRPHSGERVQWEDVSADGSSDGKKWPRP